MPDRRRDLDQPPAHPASDPRSTDELFRIALSEPDLDLRWRAVQALHWRSGREVFERAAALCAASRPIERMTGADVLAQLGMPEHEFPEEAITVLSKLLAAETDASVVASALSAFGHLGGPPDLATVAPLKDHPDASVRHSLAYALGFLEAPLAIDILIALTRDEEANVRDWATFGLGQGDADSPALRDALVERLGDDDDEVRAEAIAGLARRRDPRVLDALVDALRAQEATAQILEACEAIADPCLVPELLYLRLLTGDKPETVAAIDAAIARCGGPS